MKLLFCKNCGHVFSLNGDKRDCPCGECGGYYVDGINAQWWGNAVPLGISNQSLVHAIFCQSERSQMFDAFVIENNCPTFKQVEKT